MSLERALTAFDMFVIDGRKGDFGEVREHPKVTKPYAACPLDY